VSINETVLQCKVKTINCILKRRTDSSEKRGAF